MTMRADDSAPAGSSHRCSRSRRHAAVPRPAQHAPAATVPGRRQPRHLQRSPTPAVDRRHQPPRRASIALVATALALSRHAVSQRRQRSVTASIAAASCSGSSRSTGRAPREVARAVRRGRNDRSGRRAAGRPGVLRNREPRASHVGIALGGDQFVHAPSSRGVVRVERYTADYWATRCVGARRDSDVSALKPDVYAARTSPCAQLARLCGRNSRTRQVVLGEARRHARQLQRLDAAVVGRRRRGLRLDDLGVALRIRRERPERRADDAAIARGQAPRSRSAGNRRRLRIRLRGRDTAAPCSTTSSKNRWPWQFAE